jgi:DNA-binding NtrC family response regulator
MENTLCEKRFHEGLYYSLSVFTIKVAPLVERWEWIPNLIQEMIARTPADLGVRPDKSADNAKRVRNAGRKIRCYLSNNQ